jgi:hypothetical protein
MASALRHVHFYWDDRFPENVLTHFEPSQGNKYKSAIISRVIGKRNNASSVAGVWLNSDSDSGAYSCAGANSDACFTVQRIVQQESGVGRERTEVHQERQIIERLEA